MTAKRWRGKWVADFTTDDGRRIRRASPVQTRRGAEQFEAELRTASSISTPCSTVEIGFREFAIKWLETYAVVNNKPSEVVGKESTLRVHLVPFFENLTLDQIGAERIEAYKAAKVREGRLAAKTINNHLTVLRKLLVTAEEWRYIDRVPRIRRLPTKPSSFDWLNAAESRRFLSAMREHYPQWFVLFLTALRTGMRRGEIFALHWDDVDLVARQLQVRYSVYRGKLTSPKNGRSRWIPLTNGLTQALGTHRAATMLKGPLVFPAEDGSLTRHQDHVDRPLHGALKRAGLRRITFHTLRHSFASQLVSAGRPLREVQELLGHQSMQMTMRYAHLAPERMREAVDVLEQLAPDLEQNWNINEKTPS